MGKILRRSFAALAAGALAADLGYTFVLLNRPMPDRGAPSGLPSTEGYTGSVVVGADDRTLFVGGFGGVCDEDFTPVATESAGSVALSIKVTAAPGSGSDGACSAGQVTSASVRLNQPLGSRALVDGDGGATLASFDGSRLLRPAKLPPGYRLMSTAPYQASSGAVGAIQHWGSDKLLGQLELIQLDGPLSDVHSFYDSSDTGYQTSPPLTVRGQPATQYSATGRVGWTEGGEAMLMTWFTTDPQPSTASVIAIADSSP
ncbi:hypothetical protein [Kitasatospora viridis]|uniref:Uncharacterized protein n=1 Tax=Kitasatospora viridis TaxID=281105 RepID=A0A561TWA9_9ACTN|nr:hypothetical protein [Kitasatospora viridis]TWF91391.1 hypothetical protein FHX73_12506 [Kitasatospora viridis]